MPTRSACLAYRGPDAPHDFDPASGWCVYGCGLRRDGRHLTPAGTVIDPGPRYTPDELATIAATLTKQESHHEQPTLELPPA